MRLVDLEPQFVRHHAGPPETYEYVDALAEADGLHFLCPKCNAASAGPVGTHYVLCWFEDRVGDDVSPKPGRWTPIGTGIADLSFVPGRKSNSVALLGGCNAHFSVTNGGIEGLT